MAAENVSQKRRVSNPDEARLRCIRVAVDQGFDVEGDPLSAPWLKKGVKKAKLGERVTVADLREFDRFSGNF